MVNAILNSKNALEKLEADRRHNEAMKEIGNLLLRKGGFGLYLKKQATQSNTI